MLSHAFFIFLMSNFTIIGIKPIKIYKIYLHLYKYVLKYSYKQYKVGGFKMRRQKRMNKQIKIIVASFICLVVVMATGYAAFNTRLNIHAKGNVLSKERLKTMSISRGDGLYEDSIEKNKYVYKGTDPDNYVTFNDEIWRIVSIEADGTIKIIKNDSIGNMAFDSKELRNIEGGTYCKTSSNGCNAWAINDNYTNNDLIGTVTKDAELNTYLNSLYYSSLNDNAKKYIESHDFGVGGISLDMTLADQIKVEDSIIWTGNIALISYSEYLNANSNSEECNQIDLLSTNYEKCVSTNWLFKENNYWTISPNNDSSTLFISNSEGNVETASAELSYDVYPTLYLKSSIDLEGIGSKAEPYKIVEL